MQKFGQNLTVLLACGKKTCRLSKCVLHTVQTQPDTVRLFQDFCYCECYQFLSLWWRWQAYSSSCYLESYETLGCFLLLWLCSFILEFVATKCTHRIAEIPNSWETQITCKASSGCCRSFKDVKVSLCFNGLSMRLFQLQKLLCAASCSMFVLEISNMLCLHIDAEQKRRISGGREGINIVFCTRLALACTEILLKTKDLPHPSVQNWTL